MEFGCLAPVRVRASADETWDTNNVAVSAVLFVPGWEEPKLLAMFRMRGAADNGHGERKMSSRKATTITAMFSVSPWPSPACHVTVSERKTEELWVHLCAHYIRKNTLSLERPRKYPKGCPNTT